MPVVFVGSDISSHTVGPIVREKIKALPFDSLQTSVPWSLWDGYKLWIGFFCKSLVSTFKVYIKNCYLKN